MARTIENIEKEITQLSEDQLRQFRAWYEQFDFDAWDKQIEADAANGKLDTLAETAMADHKVGRSKKL